MEQLKAGAIRGMILALCSTGAAIGAALAQMPPLSNRALLAIALLAIALSTFFGGLLTRLLESGFDAVRTTRGTLLASDPAVTMAKSGDTRPIIDLIAEHAPGGPARIK